MLSLLRSALDDDGARLRGKIVGIYLILVGSNVIAWLWAFLAFGDHPILLGTALLAYSFGLRHAVDADHIAAIDNVTRKLMQDGKRPVAVGFFFSLGHSTVVILATVAIAVTAAAFKDRLDAFKDAGGLIGTSVSVFFLFAIALANLLIFFSIYRAFRQARRGEPIVEEDLDVLLSQRGFLGRIFRPLFRLIEKSWHMYPLGFLFGLGFETATEIGLLGISSAGATHGLSIWSILVFPALFTAGMSLIDTTDGVLMLGAYGWAFVKPIRKLYYNMTITIVSVVVALLIAGIEGLGLLADRLELKGPFWDLVQCCNDNFGTIGYGIIGLFVASWLVSYAIYRAKGLDRVEVKS